MKTSRKNFFCAALFIGLFLCGCSKSKNPPIPKSEPQLILEIFETGRKQDYRAMELKVKKLQAINPTSIFLVELENVIHRNQLFLELNRDLEAGNFVRADELLKKYEVQNGSTDELKAVRAKIAALEELEKLIAQAKVCRDSIQMEHITKRMRSLSKTAAFSRSMKNFLEKQESMILKMRASEYDSMLFGLYSDALCSYETQFSGASALSMLFTIRAPDSRETKHLMQLLTAKYQTEKSTNRKD